MRYKARTDANQKQIIEGLRSLGIIVAVTSQLGGGFPDLVCLYRHKITMLELKDGAKSPSRKRLTPAEQKFFEAWGEVAVVAENLEQAALACGAKITI